MSTGAEWALQKTLYRVLVSDTELVAKLGGPQIYDDVPQSTTFPYVTIGQMVSRDWSTSTESGLEHRFSLHVWSRKRGKAETFEIISAIREAIDNNSIELSGHVLVNLHCEATEVMRTADGETLHGILRYRGTTEPANGPGSHS